MKPVVESPGDAHLHRVVAGSPASADRAARDGQPVDTTRRLVVNLADRRKRPHPRHVVEGIRDASQEHVTPLAARVAHGQVERSSGSSCDTLTPYCMLVLVGTLVRVAANREQVPVDRGIDGVGAVPLAARSVVWMRLRARCKFSIGWMRSSNCPGP